MKKLLVLLTAIAMLTLAACTDPATPASGKPAAPAKGDA
jgi:hypothetical protein